MKKEYILPKSLDETIQVFCAIPGVGKKSAQRIVFWLLQKNHNANEKIEESLKKIRENIDECSMCHNFYEKKEMKTICPLCENSQRKKDALCLVENPMDILSIEETRLFDGKYHVLHGILSPMHNITSKDLRIESLILKLRESETPLREIIFGFSGTTEAEATSHFIFELVDSLYREKNWPRPKVSRLARGIPFGGNIDYIDQFTLQKAFENRVDF